MWWRYGHFGIWIPFQVWRSYTLWFWCFLISEKHIFYLRLLISYLRIIQNGGTKWALKDSLLFKFKLNRLILKSSIIKSPIWHFQFPILLITSSYNRGSTLQLSLIINNIVQITLLTRRIEEFECSYRCRSLRPNYKYTTASNLPQLPFLCGPENQPIKRISYYA